MTADTFHQVFDQLNDPVLLHSGPQWLTNPAAQALHLSDGDLKRLEEWGNGAFLWLSLRFFHVSAQQVDGELLLLLHPDTFSAEASKNVASQVRQKLQTAFGCVFDLSRSSGVRDDLRARERLAGINRELYQLLRMAQELELSGEADLLTRVEHFDLAQTLVKTADELKELFSHTDAELKLELDPPVLLLMGDPEKLEYLVLSLISNSMSHLPPSGGLVTLSLAQQGMHAVITVSDNGTGFPADLLSNPLWSDPQRLVFGRGLGLGLPLVQRIAAAHGGSVMAFPSDRGSRVTVSIPVESPGFLFSEPTVPLSNPSGFSPAKVLLSNALPRCVFFPNPDEDD